MKAEEEAFDDSEAGSGLDKAGAEALDDDVEEWAAEARRRRDFLTEKGCDSSSHVTDESIRSKENVGREK